VVSDCAGIAIGTGAGVVVMRSLVVVVRVTGSDPQPDSKAAPASKAIPSESFKDDFGMIDSIKVKVSCFQSWSFPSWTW